MRAIDGIVVFLHPFDGVLTDENQKKTQILLKIARRAFSRAHISITSSTTVLSPRTEVADDGTG